MESEKPYLRRRLKKRKEVEEVTSYTHYRLNDGHWNTMLPKKKDRLLDGIREGKITAISENGISEKEKREIGEEGFALSSGEIKIPKGGYRRQEQKMRILTITREG